MSSLFLSLLSLPAVATLAPLDATLPSADAQAVTSPAAPDAIVVTGLRAVQGELGGKSGIPLDKVPQSIQIITADELIANNVRSVSDILRSVPSANVGNSRVARFQSFSLRIRGFLPDQIRNGLRQRFFEDIDASALSNVERVEVIKGPSGVLFGQSAVGGIISFITKRPQEAFAAQGAILAGTYDQKQATLDITGPLTPTLSVRLTGEIERSGTFVDFQDIDRDNIAFSATFKPSDTVRAFLVAEYIERRTLNYPGLPVSLAANLPRGTFLGEPRVGFLNSSAPAVQTWVEIDAAPFLTITPRFQYQEFNTPFLQTRVLRVQADGQTVNRNGRTGDEDDDNIIAQLDINARFKTGSIGHTILAGFEYGRDRSRFFQQTITNVGPINARNPLFSFTTQDPALTFAFNSFQRFDTYALYLQDQIALAPGLDVVAGVRQSYFRLLSRFDTDQVLTPEDETRSRFNNTSFQLGSTYRLDERFTLFAGYNTGFDVENSAGSFTAQGDPLKPEKSNQIEAGLRFGTPKAQASLSLFQIERTNAITPDLVNDGFSLQIGKLRVRGVELEGTFQPIEALTLSAGYAYLSSRIVRSNDGDEGGRLGDTPKSQANARLSYTLPNLPLTLRIAGNYVGKRLLTNASSIRLQDYFLVDAGLGLALGKFNIDATLSNAFDKRYLTASGNANSVLPGDPLQFSVRLSVAL